MSTGMILIAAVISTGPAPNTSNTVLKPMGPGSMTKTGFYLPSLLCVFTTNFHRLGSTKLEMPKTSPHTLSFKHPKPRHKIIITTWKIPHNYRAICLAEESMHF